MITSLSGASANAKYSGIVIDAKTGEALYESKADTERYPASLTKLMTLYLLFDAMETGKVTKSTRIPFSRHAASEPPTKLGIKPGGSVTAETAILALVTRSANDVATAIGEFLGGSEANFARMMTNKARQLGMNHTVFKNAHGLPDPDQHTTARDMARLGMAMRDNHPNFYHYFSTRSFTYKGHRIGNHNHLLGKVEGVDGLKTGYIRASGFNLAASVKRDGRKIVAVVFGGRTARSRDAWMIKLINEYLPKASTGSDKFYVADKGNGARFALASVVLPDKNAPIPTSRPHRPRPVGMTAYAEETARPAEKALVAAVRPPEPLDEVKTASTAAPSGWVVQVASTPSESGAKAVLMKAASTAPTVLADASAFTEVFNLKGTTYYRARFGGFGTKDKAWAVCGALKKRDISCYAEEQ
jgi:D-alanyl-D-alanine carboxypeptidase